MNLWSNSVIDGVGLNKSDLTIFPLQCRLKSLIIYYTYRKLLNICLVSSDERELEKVMNEQYTAAHAAHLS